MVDDLEGLRAHLGIERLSILGHGFGGAIGLLYGERHPNRLERLALVGTAASHEAASSPPPDERAFRERWLESVPLRFHRHYVPFPLGIDLLDRTSLSLDTAAFLEEHELPRLSLSGAIGAVSCPTLVVSGRHDQLAPPESMDPLLKIDGASPLVFERSGRYPFIEETDRFVYRVRKLFARS
jgi:proline iminopeptidase